MQAQANRVMSASSSPVGGSTARRGSWYNLTSNKPPALDKVLRDLANDPQIGSLNDLKGRMARVDNEYKEKPKVGNLKAFLLNEGFVREEGSGLVVVESAVREQLEKMGVRFAPRSVRRSRGVPPIVPPVMRFVNTAITGEMVEVNSDLKVVVGDSGEAKSVREERIPKRALLFLTLAELMSFEFIRDGFFGSGDRFEIPVADTGTGPVIEFCRRLVVSKVFREIEAPEGRVGFETVIPVVSWHIEQIDARVRREIRRPMYDLFRTAQQRLFDTPFRNYNEVLEGPCCSHGVTLSTAKVVFTGFRQDPRPFEGYALCRALKWGDGHKNDVAVCVPGFEAYEFEVVEGVYVQSGRAGTSLKAAPAAAPPVTEDPVVEDPVVVAEDSTPMVDLERLLKDRPEVREALADEALAIAGRVHSGEERTFTIAELIAHRDALLAEAAKLTETILAREREVAEEKARLEAEEAELVAKLDAVRARKAKLE